MWFQSTFQKTGSLARFGKLSFRYKLCLWFGFVILLTTSLATWLNYNAAVDLALGQFGSELKALAASGALGVDGDAFQTLREPRQMETAKYQQIQSYLKRFRQSTESSFRVRYLYTMAPTRRPGIWQYVVDSEDKTSEEFSPLGDTEDFSRGDVVITSFQTGTPQADSEVTYYAGWGFLLTASSPIRDRKGKIVGVLGIDAPADVIGKIRYDLQKTALISLLAGLLFSVVVTWFLAWQVTRPLNLLIAGTQAVAAGDFAHQVKVASRDELGQLASSFNRMTEGLRQRELYKSQFERYVSRQIAEKILADPERAFWHGERRKVTILFSDITDFTKMSERLPPEDVVKHLNEYLALMVDIVFTYQGTLDKFMGDAIMAVFGAPVSLENDEERAVLAALAMQEGAKKLSRRWAQEGKTDVQFHIRIGINTGEAIVGNIGSEKRMEYSTIGDSVNVASRLEVLNKAYKTEILISESTYEAVRSTVDARLVAREEIRGRTELVNVYVVEGVKDGVILNGAESKDL